MALVTVPRGESALAVQLVAGPAVDARLINPQGHVVTTQRGSSAEGSLGMRSLRVAEPAPGRWTVRLTDTGGQAQPAVAEAWLAGDPVTATAQVAQARKGAPLTVTMRLRKGGRAYPGQRVTARERFSESKRNAPRIRREMAIMATATKLVRLEIQRRRRASRKK